jgi:antitoxin (DNA-binding transcriptional repressor) of toxin-antitoxin stability system
LIAPRNRLTEDAMTTITIQEAQARLVELIHRLSPGDEVLITEDNQPVARLSIAAGAAKTSTPSGKRDLGAALQAIKAGQKLRGFIAALSDVQPDDQGYDERMNEIYKNTIPGNDTT